MKNTLIIFVKNLQKGKVKTRIAAKKGNGLAYRLYKELLDILKKSLFNIEEWRVVVYYSHYVDFTDDWTISITRKEQLGDNLGERMFNAMHAELQLGAQGVVLIGTDIPELTLDHLDLAKLALDQNKVVLGPTFDGGYYLIGATKIDNQLFYNITWGSNSVYSETCTRIAELGWSLKELPMLQDIDEWGDVPEAIKNKLLQS